MVKRYKPDIKTEYGFGAYSEDVYHDAVMKEDAQGMYVKLSTFEDETKRLRAMIHRLENKNAALENELVQIVSENMPKPRRGDIV